ncbi:unnamed protein product [Heterobilharzia americana]|nr:unnamed protein product [Heterobilharzia americana]
MNYDFRPISARASDENIPEFEEFRDFIGSLALSFQNILKIDNLNAFTNLKKLQLNNNIIEKIENLDDLVNLTWLDLSFNRIAKIENLNKLTKLEDLSLFNNHIKLIEGLDESRNLKHFSIGNNQITELENIVYLRQFEKLESVTLSGNPVTNNPDYLYYTCAFVSQLQYLDYKKVSQRVFEEAYLKYQLKVDQLRETEKERKAQKSESYKKTEDRKVYAAAFVDDLEGDRLFEIIMEADPDGQKFASLPLVPEVFDQYPFLQEEQYYQKYQKRSSEEQSFREVIGEVKTADRAEGLRLVRQFFEYKVKILDKLKNTPEIQKEIIEDTMTGYRKRIHDLWEKLMSNEMILAEQIEDVVKEFERNIRDMIAYFIESAQHYISKCREAANGFHEYLTEATLPFAERLGKGELTKTDQVLFTDRDTMINSLVRSKDNQSLRMDECEESLIRRANEWCDKLVQTIYQQEVLERHKNRITEINLFIDAQRTELDCYDLVAI